MKFSESWLREWTNPAISSDDMVAQLTMAGLEVDSVALVAASFDNIVVAEVLETEKHPNADKLKICKVNAGGETLQIVCGASNVEPGVKVPAALVGAKLSADFVIKKAKLRGVESFGMLCSATELGLAEESDGLLILPKDAPVGQSIREYLKLDDVSIEVDLTPNRADCLSIAGLAREVAVLNKTDYTPVQFKKIISSIDDTIDINLDADLACPHYVGLIIKDINVNAETPIWLQEKLRRSGIRSIDPIVDITNYVMLELGQPMHAFDLDTLDKSIHVRFAKQDEKITLLNEQTITLSDKDLVIADKSKAIALAGVMGGIDTAVGQTTKNILLESAYFAPNTIAGRARFHGLHTDSSHRFERGVDIGLQIPAIQRAVELIVEIAGGKPGEMIEVKQDAHCPKLQTIELRYPRIKRVLGITLEKTEIEDILTRLGMTLQTKNDGWLVTVPTCRFDISIEEDLIEEVARVYGYNNIKPTRPVFELTTTKQSERHIPLRQFKQVLLDRDYNEIITYSFVEPGLQELLNPTAESCRLLNPISTDLSVMRTSMWSGLIATYLYNKNRQQSRLRLFESGLCFNKTSEGVEQISKLSGLIAGDIYPEQWGLKNRAVDFFDLKADVECLLEQSNLNQNVQFVPEIHHALHPGQSAKIMRGEQQLGIIGALHPKVAQKLSIKETVFLFELNLQAIDITDIPKFATLSKYPLIRRDIAILIKDAIPAAKIIQCIREAAGVLLVDATLFDMYQGQGVEPGYKSLALGIYLQHQAKTLQDDEVNDLMQIIIAALAEQFEAKLRD